MNLIFFPDLSRNRFLDLPEDVINMIFLEQLHLYHNTIKVVPQSIRSLTSLTFLDLRSNQLVCLPREICFLPIQILLVSNNKLIQLPDEFGRMTELTELDASSNQLSHLPTRLCELTKLRSLCLRSNQINFLPKGLQYLIFK
jgi:Leucine-rich repeat (LRR) protein